MVWSRVFLTNYKILPWPQLKDPQGGYCAQRTQFNVNGTLKKVFLQPEPGTRPPYFLPCPNPSLGRTYHSMGTKGHTAISREGKGTRKPDHKQRKNDPTTLTATYPTPGHNVAPESTCLWMRKRDEIERKGKEAKPLPISKESLSHNSRQGKKEGENSIYSHMSAWLHL